MTHTTRIYNNPKIKKAQQFNLDDKSDIHPILRSHTNLQTGIPLTKRSWICMGKDKRCKALNSPEKMPRTIRKKLKEQLRFTLKKEIETED